MSRVAHGDEDWDRTFVPAAECARRMRLTEAEVRDLARRGILRSRGGTIMGDDAAESPLYVEPANLSRHGPP